MLKTERLRVRPLSAGDAEAVQAVSGEPHPGWLEWTAVTYGQLEALRQPPYGERAICLREGGELVGMVGVVGDDRSDGDAEVAARLSLIHI